MTVRRSTSLPDDPLEAAGISPGGSRLYRHLLAAGPTATGQLVHDLQWTAEQVTQVLGELKGFHLVQVLPQSDADDLAVPAEPAPAVGSMIAAEETRLRQARERLEELQHQFAATRSRSATPSTLDVLQTREEVLGAWTNIQKTATSQVRLIDKSPYLFSPGGANPVELERLADGIRYRVIYAEESLLDAAKADAVRQSVAAGEEARIVPSAPMKIVAADERIALVHAHLTDPTADALVVRPGSLLDALLELFDLLWHRSKALGTAPSLRAEEHLILTLLAEGATDAAIARHIQQSVRTVRRRVASLMASFGASSRFELGVRAARDGTLDSPPAS